MPHYTPGSPEPHTPSFLGRLAVIYFIGALFVADAVVLWYGADVLLLLFTCILLAILLRAASPRLQSFFAVSHDTAPAIVIELLLMTLGAGGSIMAPFQESCK